MDHETILDRILIAAPCTASWDEMSGDDKVRFCNLCQLNVYNAREFTKAELTDLLSAEGKKPCLRLFRRSDGTIITENCPIGLRKLRNTFRTCARLVASCAAAFLSVIGVAANPAPNVNQPRDTNGSPVEPTILDERYMRTGRSERTLALPGTLPPDMPIPDTKPVSAADTSPSYADRLLLTKPQTNAPSTASSLERLIEDIEIDGRVVDAYSLFEHAHTAVELGRLDLAQKFYELTLDRLKTANYDPKLKALAEKELKKIVSTRQTLHQQIQAAESKGSNSKAAAPRHP